MTFSGGVQARGPERASAIGVPTHAIMPEPIRVAQVMGKMLGGGVEEVVMNYYRHIDRNRVQFDFLVDEDSTLVPREEIESLGGRVFVVPPYQELPRYLCELEALFSLERWPIVHSHVNALSVFPLRAAKRAGVSVRVAHSHSTSGRGEHVKNIVKTVLKTCANRYPTHRMACSEHAGEWLFGKGSVFDVLHNAIELDLFFFDAEARVKVREDLGLVDGQFAVGHVGRFMPQKNHRFLLEAFKLLTEARPDVVLLLVGDGGQRSFAESWVAKHGLADKVRFLGQRADVNLLYQAFDAFVLPSLYEGLGIVGVEAQRAGLPCFLSDAITREVDVTGTCEFLSIDDPEVWVDALLRIAEEPERDRSLPNMDGCFDPYDIEKAAPRLMECYERLTSGIGGDAS